MDLAKVGEITTVNVRGSRDYTEKAVNELLASGWVIISVKTIENPHRNEAWLTPALTVVVLGKSREKQKPAGETIGQVFGIPCEGMNEPPGQ